MSIKDNHEREAIDLWIRAHAARLWLRTNHHDQPGTEETYLDAVLAVLPGRTEDANLLHEQLNAWQDQREALLRYAQGLIDGMSQRPEIVASDAAYAIRNLLGETDE